MRELSKYFRIYCHETHKKWPELVPYVDNWLNSSVSQSTGYSPVELLYGNPEPDVFRGILKKTADQLPQEDTLSDKILKAYARIKLRADRRNERRKTGKTQWQPKLNELVLVKIQPVSDTVQGSTSKFQRPYEGPFLISRRVNPSIFELSGLFSLKHLKRYHEETSNPGLKHKGRRRIFEC
jgi:hypothetical protein